MRGKMLALTTCISLPWSPDLFCYVDRRRVVMCAKNCWDPLRTGRPWAPRGDVAVEGKTDQEGACTGGGWGRRQLTTGTPWAGCRERGAWMDRAQTSEPGCLGLIPAVLPPSIWTLAGRISAPLCFSFLVCKMKMVLAPGAVPDTHTQWDKSPKYVP